MDPVLAFLVASGVFAGFQAVYRLVKGGRLYAISKHVDEKCLECLVIEDVACVEENIGLFKKIVEVLIASDAVRGFIVGKKSVDRRKLIEDIENKIMTLRVILEREPGNKRVERRIRMLEKMYERLLQGVVYTESVIAFVVDACSEGVEWVEAELRRIGCKVRRVSFTRISSIVAGVKRAGRVAAPTLAETIVAGIQSTPASSGVYIGRRRDKTPFLLELWRSSGSLHYVILGPTGRGKTTLASILLVRAYSMGFDVYGVDPKGDLARYTSGFLDVYRVSLRDAIGNALWLYREGVIDYTLLEKMFTEVGVYIEREAVETAVEECRPLGTVVDGPVKQKLLRLGLSSVTSCTSALSPRTSTVYDLSRLPEYAKTATLVSIAYLLLWGRGKRLLVIDEAWRLGRIASEHITRLYKEARSREVALVSATQDPGDLPPEVYNNAYGAMIFGSQDRGYVTRVSKILGLSDQEAMVLRSLGVGEVLVKVYGRRAEIVEVDAEGLPLEASL